MMDIDHFKIITDFGVWTPCYWVTNWRKGTAALVERPGNDPRGHC